MSARLIGLVTRVVLPLVAVASLFGGIDVVQADEEGSGKIALQTVYLRESVGPAHWISIDGQAPGDAKVVLDPNSCGLNEFGDRTVCTRMAQQTVDVEIVRLRLADESNQGRAIYEMRGALTPQDSRWLLVGPPKDQTHFRLVVQTGEDRRLPITLEPRRRSEPNLCTHVEYSAEQATGEVTIIARGSNPTAGYEVRFEQLPIEIFPPQFRLLCIPPSGIVPHVVTPFEVTTSFRATEPIKKVTVHDADGENEIPVGQGAEQKGG